MCVAYGPSIKNESFLNLYMESFLFKGHNIFHKHFFFNRLHFCQPMEFLVTYLGFHWLWLGLMLAVQSTVVLYLIVKRSLLIMGATVFFLGGSRTMFSISRSDPTPEILSVRVIVVLEMVFEISACSAVFLVVDDWLLFLLLYFNCFVFLELWQV